MSLISVALIGFAGYRIWRVLALDTILDKPRDWAHDQWEPGRKILWYFLDLISCAWCLGFWITGALSLLAWAVQGWDWSWLTFVLVWLASSTVTGLISKIDG